MARTIHLIVPQLTAVSEGFVFVIPSAGPEPGAQCELSPVNASHPVQALMESFTALSGCASRGTVGLPQEVHVLNLRAADQGPGQPQREVGVVPACYPLPLGICLCTSLDVASSSSILGLMRMLVYEHKWGGGHKVHERERGGFKLIQKDCSLNWANLGLLSRELSRLFTFPAHPPPRPHIGKNVFENFTSKTWL